VSKQARIGDPKWSNLNEEANGKTLHAWGKKTLTTTTHAITKSFTTKGLFLNYFMLKFQFIKGC
jgi:hypothetical protein